MEQLEPYHRTPDALEETQKRITPNDPLGVKSDQIGTGVRSAACSYGLRADSPTDKTQVGVPSEHTPWDCPRILLLYGSEEKGAAIWADGS